jgi:hypothetical protein
MHTKFCLKNLKVKRPLGRRRLMLEDDIETNLRGTEF